MWYPQISVVRFPKGMSKRLARGGREIRRARRCASSAGRTADKRRTIGGAPGRRSSESRPSPTPTAHDRTNIAPSKSVSAPPCSPPTSGAESVERTVADVTFAFLPSGCPGSARNRLTPDSTRLQRTRPGWPARRKVQAPGIGFSSASPAAHNGHSAGVQRECRSRTTASTARPRWVKKSAPVEPSESSAPAATGIAP